MKYKIHGLQRTGTNYLNLLLTTNYDLEAEKEKGGWKHGFYEAVEMPVIVTVKNPYSWIDSIHRYSNSHREKRKRMDLPTFIRSKYSFEGMESESPMDHWNKMNNHWWDLASEIKTYTIPYEHIQQDPKMTCDSIANVFNLPKSEKFYNPTGVVLPSEQEYSQRPFDNEYYNESLYLKKYSKEDLSYINDCLDYNLMECFGYDVIK